MFDKGNFLNLTPTNRYRIRSVTGDTTMAEGVGDVQLFVRTAKGRVAEMRVKDVLYVRRHDEGPDIGGCPQRQLRGSTILRRQHAQREWQEMLNDRVRVRLGKPPQNRYGDDAGRT
ncbi:unnamed protein product [Vitrella brassicaformis CCMP3155]|uniref:Uncharacterized protein n=1 Tax=Vitrella brassicaformis (strain CCMP3155) TaxID=1169540 RepID=A0A0G4FWC6_VITBC|nr:unnamed protein product [Vitrella brassicaformis CCMP3155]|eukprot:CEM19505.1 unnamed protein product [Vitrella brassicaformis CCMP3155]